MKNAFLSNFLHSFILYALISKIRGRKMLGPFLAFLPFFSLKSYSYRESKATTLKVKILKDIKRTKIINNRKLKQLIT